VVFVEQLVNRADSLRLLVGTGRNQINIAEAVHFAWSAYRAHWRLFTGVLGAMLGAWVVLEIVVVTTQRLGIVAWALAHIAFLLCFAGMEVGLLRVSLVIQNARNPTLADAFKHFNLGPCFLAGQLLYLAMVLVGLVFLIVPGIFLATRLSLFSFQIAAGDSGVLQSLRQSAVLTRGATGRLAATLVALVVFNLLGAALLGLGLVVTVPLSVLTMASIHRQLSAAARGSIRLETTPRRQHR
jgi:uncharacterized membrane protein